MVAILVVLFRWLHVIAAAIAVGGVVFMLLVLPAGIARIEAEQRQRMLEACRAAFKRIVHTCIALLLISGTYNLVRNLPQYSANPGTLHGLLGLHILLALAVFCISIWLLLGDKPRASHRWWLSLNAALLLAAVAAASTLKWARETAVQHPVATQPGRQ